MAASHDPLDDRQHGHAIRRRQGGRTSIYHDQLFPQGALHKALGETFETYDGGDLARAAGEGVPGALEEMGRRRKHDLEWDRAVAARGIPGSDGSTGAY